MASPTVPGGGTTTGSNQITTTSSATLALAQSIINTIGTISAANTVTSTTVPSSVTSPSTPTPIAIGGTTPVSLGVVNVGVVSANVTAVLINNTGTTTLTNTSASTNQSVVGGSGSVNFTDAGTGTTVVVGGGSNAVTFSSTSSGAKFVGDGTNTIAISATTGTTTIQGTGSSVDSISATSKGNVSYTATAGATAIVQATSGNVTVVGAVGATQTVFGGSGATIISDGNGGFKTINASAFTGTLTATNVTGYAEGGTGGKNVITGNSTGASTLVGGGSGDTLVAGGAGDNIVARARGGNTTIDGSQAAGGINEWADVNGNNTNSGAVTMYGSKSVADNFYLSTSTVAGTTNGVAFKGSLVTLHHASDNTTVLNTNVANKIDVGVFNNFAQFATVTDFISGTDKLVIGQGQGTVSIASSGTTFSVTTASGSTITVQGTISLTDITRI